MDLWLWARVKVELCRSRGSRFLGTGRLRLTGSLGDVCAFSFASNCADALTLFFPVLGDQREWRASVDPGEKLRL